MPHVKIVCDGDTVIDRDLDEWSKHPPEFEGHFDPLGQTPPQPWMQVVLILMAQALLKQEPFEAAVDTDVDGWMQVRTRTPKPNPLLAVAGDG